jgi:rsbT co-antagonist protein RsbR
MSRGTLDAAREPSNIVTSLLESGIEAMRTQGSSGQQSIILRTLLDNLSIVVWAIDPEGNYTYQEGKGLGAIGLTPGAFVGKNMFTMFPGDTSTSARLALKGEITTSVVEVMGAYWESWSVPIRDENGTITGVIGLSLDVSDRERAKAELEVKLELIARQEDVIKNLETPILQVWDQVLAVPMVGVVDSRRAARLMDDLLAETNRLGARFVILDLTGVELMDTATAGHIVAMIGAIRLLGATGIITGIRPTIAQAMVSLGLDMSSIPTMARLRDGLAFCSPKMARDSTSAGRAGTREPSPARSK